MLFHINNAFTKNHHFMTRKKKELFSDETIASLVELGEVLRKIHMRILSEGYTYKDGQFYPTDEEQSAKSE